MDNEEIKLAEERATTYTDIPTHLPVLPLRDVVVFPYMIYPVLLGRESSLRAATYAIERHKYIFLAAQKNAELEEPTKDDIFHEGTVAKIIQIMKLPNGLMKIIVDGISQASITSFSSNEQFMDADIKLTVTAPEQTSETDALVRHVSSLFTEYAHLNRALSRDILAGFESINNLHRKLFYIAANVSQSVEAKQKLLQVSTLNEQYYEMARLLTAELDVLHIEKDIDIKVHDSIQKSQKKFIIQEQIRILQDELGSDEILPPELAKLKEQI